MNDAYHRRRTLSAKRLADYIRAHPEGVTRKDLDAAGIPIWGMDRLIKLGHIYATRIREPERGPRCYHWLWKPSTLCKGAGDE